jgi:hypothetical protein
MSRSTRIRTDKFNPTKRKRKRDSDVGIYDRSVVQEVLKEIAQTQQVDLNAKKRFKGKSIFSHFPYEHTTMEIARD